MKTNVLIGLVLILVLQSGNGQIQKQDEAYAYRFNGNTKLFLLDPTTDSFKYVDETRTTRKHYYAENTLFQRAGNYYDEREDGERIKYYKIKIVRYKHNVEVTDAEKEKYLAKQGASLPDGFQIFRTNPKKGDPTYVTIFKSENKVGNGDENKTFLIRQSDFEENEKEGLIFKEYDTWKPSLGYGAQVSVPFKLRPKINEDNFRLTPELQLGGYLSLRFRFDERKSRYLHFPFITAGIGGLGINKDNIIDESTNTGEGLVMGLTTSLGSAIELDGFQLGVMIGWDKAGGEIGKDWIYNGRPWYSFGIGFTFLNGGRNENDNNENEKEKQ